jgi:hypothetical protein
MESCGFFFWSRVPEETDICASTNAAPLLQPTALVSEADSSPTGQKIAAAEVLLLCGSVLSLLTSCVLWSSHKQPWMDEIFTWKEVSDPSLWHLYYAIQHGADGGQPLFYTTAWLWAKAFGAGAMSLRMYSSVSVCGALLVTWRALRRFYGIWATAVGVLFFWGTSGVLLEQNVEARFYGLYLLCVAITVDLYTRLVDWPEMDRPEATRRLWAYAFFSQAALVLTHILGLIYSALILSALILFDSAKGRRRWKLYGAYTAGWLALLVWLPAIRASMAAGKPHGWIAMPSVTDLRTSYLFADSLPWLKFFKLHCLELGFQIVTRAAELVIYGSLAIVFLFALRSVAKSGWRILSDRRSALLLVAYSLLAAPVVLFVLSHLIAPVFVPRYLLPSGIGLAIVLTALAEELNARVHGRGLPRPIGVAIVFFLMILPVLTVAALGPASTYRGYLDVSRLEHLIPPDGTLVAGWQEDFARLMRLADHPTQYYFLLDWPAAIAGPRSFVLDYHLMQAYRNSGYYSNNIQDNHAFLCSHTDFWVLDAPNTRPLKMGSRGDTLEMEKPNWFDLNIKTRPEFQWKVIASFDATEVTRNLIAVHKKSNLPFCE